jgi:hypothetical protein
VLGPRYLVTNCRTSTQVEIVGCNCTLIGICVAIGRYRQLFQDIAPSTPHYNQLFHSSLVSLSVTSDPTVESYWKIQCFLRGRMLRLLGHEHLLYVLIPPCGQNPLTHIYAAFSLMYDAHLIKI